MLGNALFTWIVKKSFYAQFVAGEDAKLIKPKIDHLKSFGVKAIFGGAVVPIDSILV